ncbi:WD40 repeat domain-containing protein [Magnetospira sp. QH-2]|uniref:WD40 repeat domain-containing protein n=1 Tax=Magnetospira sp. (strain QH-2) TaxID=1288970 RepID=UPI0003E80EEB|nr:hypothetical protein [Magnetospira sp. QH-2]CCQ74207.1 Putative WD-40 repeat protein [Magnetospira sp. QH-2]
MYSGCVKPGCEDPGCGEGGIDAGAMVVSPDVTSEEFDLGAYVNGVCHGPRSNKVAVGLGDGRVLAAPISRMDALKEISRHEGVVSALAPFGEGFISGGDDGRVLFSRPDGGVEELHHFEDQWVEHMAVHEATGTIAVTVGRDIHLLDRDGNAVGVCGPHQSTLSGLALSADGTMVAASHYDGATLWTAGADKPSNKLYWKGSHTGVTLSPNNRYLVTATQEKELHCWNLETGKDMKMSGYPAKIRSLDWTHDGRFLAAAGADVLTSWSFDGSGPSGRPPLELGYVFNAVVSSVAVHPHLPLVIGGYDSGTVLIGDIERGDALIARPTGQGSITATCWGGDTHTAICGTADGKLACMTISGEMLQRPVS